MNDEIVVAKALSLTQPWATLCAIGAKTNETRSWLTHYRGRVAIHASKGFPPEARALCYQERFAKALARAGYNHPDELPLGKVLSVHQLADCLSTNGLLLPNKDSDEYAFGDYSRDRWFFVLNNGRRLKEPFECRGALGLWTLPRQIMGRELT